MIYKLLVAFLFGVIAGIFLWEKWGVGDQYKAYISKLKQKGKGNRLDSNLDVNLTPQTKSEGILSKRKRKRIEKRKKKSEEKLELK